LKTEEVFPIRKTSYISYSEFALHQRHSRSLTFLDHILGPYRSLYLTDMSFMQQYHAQTTLSDTATDTQRQFTFQQLFVEIQFFSFLFSLNGELTKQGILIHTYTHRRQFESTVKYRIPNQDITVESHLAVLCYRRPVIIVGSPTVVLLTITHLTADTHHEHSTVFLAYLILTLFRRKVRIHLQQVFAMYEMNMFGQERLDLRISLTSKIFRTQDSRIDTFHDILQKSDGTLLAHDDGFPVPLVHIQGMEIVQFLVSADSVHIRIYSVSRFDIIFCQCKTFPFSQ